MAGIGFELKKLFKNKSLLLNLRAYLYSSIVTVGPFLLCTIMITSLQILLSYMNFPYLEQELFLGATIYAFIFSQIITSGFSMIITRYVSDKLYIKEFEQIIPSLYGIMTICLCIGGVLGVIFYFISPLPFLFKTVAYILFMELIIMWLQATYLTALKDYMKIVLSFLSGVFITLLCAYILLYYSTFSISLSFLFSLSLGIFFIITSQMFFIENLFPGKRKKLFLFLPYLDRYPSLFFINFFYTLGLYVHNFIFWKSSYHGTIGNTYIYCPIYDVATFYAFLTTLPSMVLFVVSIETSFYDKYKAYYSLITKGGTLWEIKRAKLDMTSTLWGEILHVMEIQIFFTISLLIIGRVLLPSLGLITLSIDIYTILCLGAYCNIIMLILLLIELYFEDRKGALMISTSFVLGSSAFSLLTLNLGENFYGIGFFVAALLSLVIGMIRLQYFLNNIKYYTFCSQPIVYKESNGFFTDIVDKLYSSEKHKYYKTDR